MIRATKSTGDDRKYTSHPTCRNRLSPFNAACKVQVVPYVKSSELGVDHICALFRAADAAVADLQQHVDLKADCKLGKRPSMRKVRYQLIKPECTTALRQ